MISKKQFGAVTFIVIVITALLTWSINNFVVYGIGDEMTGKFRTIAGIIQRSSYYDIPEDILQDGSIRGMVDSLDDPDSIYLTPDEAQAFENSFLAEYMGVGIRTTKIISGFMVVDVAAKSPAAEAGVKQNDIIIKINNDDIQTSDNTISELLKKNTLQELTVLRDNKEVIIPIQKATVDFTTSISHIQEMNDKKILVFDLQEFTDKTADLFAADLKKMADNDIDGVVIDLRNNTGGSVDVAKKILAMTVRGKDENNAEYNYLKLQNKEQARIEKNAKEQSQAVPADAFETFVSNNKAFMIKQPTVILVNEKTASAAEMVAAGMNQIDGIALIGNSTYGKGTVQEVIPVVSDGSAIKLTTKKWFTPTGENLTPEHPLIPTENSVDSIPYTISTLGANKEYKNGDKDSITSTTIADTQMILSYFGYNANRADGLFDDATETQIKKFQKDNDIKETGKIDSKTLWKINEQLIKYTQDVQNDVTMQKAFVQLEKKINTEKAENATTDNN